MVLFFFFFLNEFLIKISIEYRAFRGNYFQFTDKLLSSLRSYFSTILERIFYARVQSLQYFHDILSLFYFSVKEFFFPFLFPE